MLLYEYKHLIGDVSAVCSVYPTRYNSWYPLLVFDGGIHNYPETQSSLFRTEIGVNYIFAVDGDMNC